MFDTAKVQQMLPALEEFARAYEDIYVIPEWLDPESFALFRRMKIIVRAILSDELSFNVPEIFGIPVMPLSDTIKNFTAQTGIIYLSAKPQPVYLNTGTFDLGNSTLKVPLFAVSPAEVLAIYDRLTILKIMQQYREDGITLAEPQDFATRFARGLTTFLNPDTENIKFQFRDRSYFAAPKYDVDDTAIVLRGQILHENHYTERTFEFYRSIYPNTPIVVSTWKDEISPDLLKACEKNSVILLGNTQPATPGWGHLNYQKENGLRGIEYVKQRLGVKFILITRTDQRLNKFDFLLHFRNLIRTFPPFSDRIHGRIITLGGRLTQKYLPFRVTDFLFFGYVDDILKIFDFPYLDGLEEFQYRKIHRNRFFDMAGKLNKLGFVKCNLAERRKRLRNFNVAMNKFVNADIFWLKNFYRNHIAPIDNTVLLETWHKFMRECLLLVDLSEVGFDWSKYDDNRRYICDDKGTYFSQWLDLYRNFHADWV